jgi:hypothetical protein
MNTTPYEAVLRQDVVVLKILIDAEADVNDTATGKPSALQVAVARGWRDVFDLLMGATKSVTGTQTKMRPVIDLNVRNCEGDELVRIAAKGRWAC